MSTVSITASAVDDFWRFVIERHEMFRRRFLGLMPPPWTTDPVLGTYYFTNPYRTLDRDTRYALLDILGPSRGVRATLWSTVLFRRGLTVESHAALDQAGYLDPDRFDAAGMKEVLLARARAGERVWTNAFRINFTAQRYRGPAEYPKIHQQVERFAEAHRQLSVLVDVLQWATTMKEAHAVLVTLPGVGAFGAYQILVDLTYPEGPLKYPDVNDWAAFGKGLGSEKGLAELGVSSWQALDAMRWLRDNQPEWPGPKLTMANLAHSLCEYSKLCAIRRGDSAKRRYDAAEARPIDARLWPPKLVWIYARDRVPSYFAA